MKRDRFALLGVVWLLGAAPAAEGQVFKCTDVSGKVTYTDVPCLYSEKSAVVDTRSNVSDGSSLRQAAARQQSAAPAPATQGQAPAASAPPPQPQRVLKDFARRGY